jgi:hypothetical protein
MTRRTFFSAVASSFPRAARAETPPARFHILDPNAFRHHIEFFNGMAPEDVVNAIPDSQAFDWIAANVPLFRCPDPEVERAYYYRWWTFRKHIKETPRGYVITEFLRPVKHATDFNAISCALGHHISEGRWIRDPRYLDQYLDFWLRPGEGGGLQRHYHQYSNWTAYAVLERYRVDLRRSALTGLLDALVLDYETWEKERLLPSGLFWQYDVRDGMEETVSGSRRNKNARPTINSYMYGNALAVSAIAALAGKPRLSAAYRRKARALKALVQSKLWDPQARFFKVLLDKGRLADVREIMGYTPWYFALPEPRRGYEEAWRQLMDPKGFHAPFGPTTAEQRHPGFRIAEEGDDCQWNGPSWPFSTTVTLKALARLLAEYPQQSIGVRDYFETFQIYTRSQRLKLPDGRVIPWIDENLNPYTGEWHARARKIKKGTFNGRGDHYNHSAYCDLVITGVAGLRPREDNVVELHPLLPQGVWQWFCLDGVSYHGKTLTVLWDQSGKEFGMGQGLRIFVDGKLLASAPQLRRITASLPS